MIITEPKKATGCEMLSDGYEIYYSTTWNYSVIVIDSCCEDLLRFIVSIQLCPYLKQTFLPIDHHFIEFQKLRIRFYPLGKMLLVPRREITEKSG
jgi:hypothetical protein